MFIYTINQTLTLSNILNPFAQRAACTVWHTRGRKPPKQNRSQNFYLTFRLNVKENKSQSKKLILSRCFQSFCSTYLHPLTDLQFVFDSLRWPQQSLSPTVWIHGTNMDPQPANTHHGSTTEKLLDYVTTKLHPCDSLCVGNSNTPRFKRIWDDDPIYISHSNPCWVIKYQKTNFNTWSISTFWWKMDTC